MSPTPRLPYLFNTDELDGLLVRYNSLEGVRPPSAPDSVKIWDETLRDGEQTPGVYLQLSEKLDLAKALDEIGVNIITVGFPAVSETEKEIVKAFGNEGFSQASIAAIARPRLSDIEACAECGVQMINIFMPTSELLLQIFHNTHEQALKMVTDGIELAKSYGMHVNWVMEDATRSRMDYLETVTQSAIDAGAERVVLSDTVGVMMPFSWEYFVRTIKERIPKWRNYEIPMGVHVHNDFGVATAGTIMAVFEGVTYPHTCINGYGERAGNAALEEVVMALEYNGVATGIKTEKLFELSQLAEKYFLIPLTAHKPIVGEFCFSHESGLHINAIIAHPGTYEPINPQRVGRERHLYMGKFSGTGAIREKLRTVGLELPEDVVRQIVSEVKRTREETSKEENREKFAQVKELLKYLKVGFSDKEFFEIIRRVAGPDFKGEWQKAINAFENEKRVAENANNKDDGEDHE